MMNLRLPILVVASISFALVGCDNNYVFPNDLESMAEVYDDHFREAQLQQPDIAQARNRLSRPVAPHDINLDGYVRDAQNEIHALFPVLPNPTLVMFVYPHLTPTGRHPVPGYSTSFSMYEKDEYALPGEVAERQTK